MNQFVNPGTNVTQRATFNSAYIDFGNSRLVSVDSGSISIEWTTMGLYTLNSIKPQDLVRHTQKVTMSGKIKSFPPELLNLTLGSSSAGTPQEIDTLDGQPTLTNPVVTITDRNGKEIQYQLSGALFKSSKLTSANESYGEWDFELEAKDIAVVYTV